MRVLALTLLALGGLALALPAAAACPNAVSASKDKAMTVATADGNAAPTATPIPTRPGN